MLVLLLCCADSDLLNAQVVPPAESAATTRRPNVILIMADDVSWECFGCYGAQDYQTPNIDALAAQGIRFNHCYSTPLCTPSRVKIMTGKYSFRNYTHFGYLNPAERTFGQMMKSAGYKTAIAGKWQLNGLYHSAAGADDNTRPLQAGFDEYCLWQLTRAKDDKNGGERFWSPPLEQNTQLLSKQQNEGKYGPDLMSDFLCDFIRRNQEQPYFVYYPTVLVHNPFVPTPDTIGDAPRTHDANRAPKNKAEQKANFVAMVNYLDKIIGKLVDTVRETGQLENTLILFTADNGTNKSISSRWQGQTIHGGKGTTTDMGHHVPLVAYWKNHTPQGVVLEDLIDFTDFYATLAALAEPQQTAADPTDGRSFLPQLRGEPGNPRHWVLNHYQPYWGQFKGTQYVRDQDFKLYRSGDFFNVPNDLLEANPLPASPLNSAAEVARAKLHHVLETAPPPPPLKAGKQASERPTYPDWNTLADPND
ncbi:sulfatase-like hydrolase/transferase [Stieleria sp. TO1_6]|uniref:sulfatase-like hydrolase/transferase n=1 Tax=Stieleria tagensis TaxID=2956795 RepID=UPI00209B082A|nr:sulfatase-like hydrolase/transferase [Stieleria tagensis]MCO8125169.1 sulfatase-like hydrolase/transferase [Stieleria tagensis]